MKKLLFLFISAMLFLSSCKKDDKTDTTLHGTRLKTYTLFDMKQTITYNSFNKIDNIKTELGAQTTYTYLKYKPDHSLDSVIGYNFNFSSYYRESVKSDNFRITEYDDNVITYNTNNTINTTTNSSIGSYTNRYEYRGDSVMIYYKNGSSPEVLNTKYKLSSSIKNPFYITGFEAERFVLFSILGTVYPPSTAMLPYAETKNTGIGYSTNYTYEGNFNGYPLKRIQNNDVNIAEIFTYEEF